MFDSTEAQVTPESLKKDTMEFCHKCDEVTRWSAMSRGSRREQCSGCKDVFPCRSGCDHLDCRDEKSSWVKTV